MAREAQMAVPLGPGASLQRLQRGRHAGAPALIKNALHEPAPAAEVAALRRECELIARLDVAATLQRRMIDAPAAALVPRDPGGDLLSDWVTARRRAPLSPRRGATSRASPPRAHAWPRRSRPPGCSVRPPPMTSPPRT